MPANLDKCVAGLLAKWKKDPASRPTAKDGQDAKSQAHAICTAALKKSKAESLEIMLSDGFGPALIGAAATNRPYIPKLKPTQVVEIDGESKLLVHLANPGFFDHPSGPFVLNRPIFLAMQKNFADQVTGQDAAYDARHKPQAGALGWFTHLLLGDEIQVVVGDVKLDSEPTEKEFWGLVDPTPPGIQAISGGEFKYSSMEFHRNWKRDDVKLDLELATGDFCPIVNLEVGVEEEEEDSVSDKELKKLEQEKASLAAKVAELEQDGKNLKLAEERLVKLEAEAMEAKVAAVVARAETHRDEEGNGLPKPLIEWFGGILRFGEIGEGDDPVKLSKDSEKPGRLLLEYLIDAVGSLIEVMPGSVPLERKSSSGREEDGEEDEFDYAKEWEE